MDPYHPILGCRVRSHPGEDVGRVYTRTVVLWAVNIRIDPALLWQHVEVVDEAEASVGSLTPQVRMLTTASGRRGTLPKRMRSSQTFRSVLSMDVAHRGYMPNLKVSARNTIQITGAQDLTVLGDILHHLTREYDGRGFSVVGGGNPPGFVGDVVLANVHFRLDYRLDRSRLRDVINAERGPFIASYEPLVRDVSVSLKYADSTPLPNAASVHPRWLMASNQWTTVPLSEALRLVPHINLKSQDAVRVSSLRVFQSGSVIIVARWPEEMRLVHQRFTEDMRRLRRRVIDPEFARQRTIPECWNMDG